MQSMSVLRRVQRYSGGIVMLYLVFFSAGFLGVALVAPAAPIWLCVIGGLAVATIVA